MVQRQPNQTMSHTSSWWVRSCPSSGPGVVCCWPPIWLRHSLLPCRAQKQTPPCGHKRTGSSSVGRKRQFLGSTVLPSHSSLLTKERAISQEQSSAPVHCSSLPLHSGRPPWPTCVHVLGCLCSLVEMGDWLCRWLCPPHWWSWRHVVAWGWGPDMAVQVPSTLQFWPCSEMDLSLVASMASGKGWLLALFHTGGRHPTSSWLRAGWANLVWAGMEDVTPLTPGAVFWGF